MFEAARSFVVDDSVLENGVTRYQRQGLADVELRAVLNCDRVLFTKIHSFSRISPAAYMLTSVPWWGSFFCFFSSESKTWHFLSESKAGLPSLSRSSCHPARAGQNVCTRKVKGGCFYCGLGSYCKKQLPAAAAIAEDIGHAHSK